MPAILGGGRRQGVRVNTAGLIPTPENESNKVYFEFSDSKIVDQKNVWLFFIERG
jgi:hypothetical protein